MALEKKTYLFQIKVWNTSIQFIAGSENCQLSIDKKYRPFCISENQALINVTVFNFIQDIPDSGVLLFTTKKNLNNEYSKILWEIYKTNNEFIIRFFEVESPSKTFVQLFFSPKTTNWNLYFSKTEINDNLTIINPLLYPIGALVTYYATFFNGAISIHGAGINYESNGLIFSGFSGRGKTTISRLWNNAGYKVINDDRLVLFKNAEKYFMSNTPMPAYTDVPKSAEVKALFLIEHAPKNFAIQLSEQEAIKNIFQVLVQHNYHKEFIEMNLIRVMDFCKKIPVYKLGFLPNSSIIEYIKNMEFLK